MLINKFFRDIREKKRLKINASFFKKEITFAFKAFITL